MPGLGREISNRVMKRKRNARPDWGGGEGVIMPKTFEPSCALL